MDNRDKTIAIILGAIAAIFILYTAANPSTPSPENVDASDESVHVFPESRVENVNISPFTVNAGGHLTKSVFIPKVDEAELIGRITIVGNNHIKIQLADNEKGDCGIFGCQLIANVIADGSAESKGADNGVISYKLPATGKTVYLRFDNTESTVNQVVNAALQVKLTEIKEVKE